MIRHFILSRGIWGSEVKWALKGIIAAHDELFHQVGWLNG